MQPLWLVDMLKARCLRDVLNLSSASQKIFSAIAEILQGEAAEEGA